MIKKIYMLIITMLSINSKIIYAENQSVEIITGEKMKKSSCSVVRDQELPEYVAIDFFNLEGGKGALIRIPAKIVKFPLSMEDKNSIDILIRKFDTDKDCVGLAAPHIGIPKRIIIFAVPDDPELKKRRLDLTQTMPKTLWINPSYRAIGHEMHEDYEGSVSIQNVVALVKRYKSINYRAFDQDGKMIEGRAEGFLARVIQHEIDHLDGKLFTDLVAKDKIITTEEYKKIRAEMAEKENMKKE